jgi:nicotinamide-nucleotide amidase
LQAEIISIGTELLLGEIVDTNSAWIAQRLTTIGLNLYHVATVGDNLQRITAVMRSALQRSDVVITTGGLGPTVDDVTREAVAAATDRDLVFDEELLQEIACFFARRNYQMTDNNRKQATIPAGALIIHNPVGTAPSFAVEHHGHLIISLPGVPHEMRHLMESEVLPLLQQRFGLKGIIRSRILHTCGIGESTIDSRIDDLMHLSNPTVGTAAHPGQTDVRVAARGDTEEEVLALIEPVEREIRTRLGEFIFGVDRDTIGDVVTGLLAAKSLRLALVDGVTCGELVQRLANGTQAEQAFAGALVLSSREAFARVLHLPEADLEQYGLSSREVAEAAAQTACRLHGADLGLAVLGPRDSGVEVPAAAPTHFSLATADGVLHTRSAQGRSGPSGRGWLIHLALDLVRRYLLGLPIG